MLKKSVATLVAFLLALGLSIAALSPSYADDATPTEPVATESPSSEPQEEPAADESPAPAEEDAGDEAPPAQTSSAARSASAATSYPTTPPAQVDPIPTDPTCESDGSILLPDVAGVTWYVNGTVTAAGTVPAAAGDNIVVKAEAASDGVIPGATRDSRTGKWTRTWTFSMPFVECEPELTGEISAICLNDAPYIHYSVTLIDPDHLSTSDQAVLTLAAGSDSFTYSPALGTITDGTTLEGDLLWPGASVDPITGEANGWPGWEYAGGVWQETTGNYAWSRDGVTATIAVNPELVASLEYPPGNPDCYPGPQEVTPTLTTVETDCDAVGTYTLDDIEGIQWWVDGVPVDPDTYPGSISATAHVTATATGPYVLDPDATTSWDLDFPVGEDCLGLVGSSATGTCEAGSPWIHYQVVLTDPFGEATSHDAELIMSDGTNTVTIPLGTIDPTTLSLSGDVLWPGASIDPVTGEPNGWPGWELVDGEWQETTGNYAWTRSITSATISVNPTMTVALAYPTASPDCLLDPPSGELPTDGLFPTSATLSEQCTTDGSGVLTLGLVDGVSFFEDVNYFVDGVPAASSTVYLSKGVHQVTVTTKSPTDGLDGPTAWQIVVTGGQTCGQLDTLALTGAPTGGWIAAVGALLAIVAGAVLARKRPRTEA
ncbi:hypothetical protein [Homoserinibacter sp. GY 40078]|uniref:hypothetical protein n=1 Tax=Homoserinibacter sp. GY 40078 TaxID=2603275 RepID=UPI0011CA1741|nr:hypothetical protein [Homoserinibacter sp. GY 40078]TXK18829.1 hypothetical protein FVQ89_02490 [Homoserinibacter sp. GY 40078]